MCLDGEGIACTLVQSALPPGSEVVDGVGQASGFHIFGCKVEDGNCLSFSTFKSASILTWNEDPVICIASYFCSHAHVFHQQTDVGDGVVLPFSGSANNGDTTLPLLQKELDGLGLVIRFLVGVIM